MAGAQCTQCNGIFPTLVDGNLCHGCKCWNDLKEKLEADVAFADETSAEELLEHMTELEKKWEE